MRCASIPLSARWFRIASAVSRQHRLMQDGDLVPAGEQFVQLAQQAGTDDHRVRRVDGHLDGDRFRRSVMCPPRRDEPRRARPACGGGGPVRARARWAAAATACGATAGGGDCARCRPVRVLQPRTMWRTTAPGLRRLVLTRIVATCRYSGTRWAISARYFSARSRSGQQRAHGVAAGAPNAFGRADFQVDDGVAGQRVAHTRSGDRAAARATRRRRARPAPPHHVFLDAAELLLAVGGEDVGDACGRSAPRSPRRCRAA